MFSSYCGLNLVKENGATSLRDALLQALVSHLNIEIPLPLISLPETHLNLSFIPVLVSHHTKPQVSWQLHLQQNPKILDLLNGGLCHEVILFL